MFGFWLDLLEAPFEDPTSGFALWPLCQPNVFPHDVSMTRAKAESILSGVKRLRNRVSHHEPAWSVARPLTPLGVQNYMTNKIGEMESLLNAMNADVVALLINAGIFQRLSWLLDPQTISSFSTFAAGEKIDFKRLNRVVRKLVKKATPRRNPPAPNPNMPYCLTHGGRPLLALIPYS